MDAIASGTLLWKCACSVSYLLIIQHISPSETRSSVFLLQRADIDPTIKDLEGYTAFDVYNSTVEGTKPCERGHNELFVWGSNRYRVPKCVIQFLMY